MKISYTLTEAAAATGLSEWTLDIARKDGSLTVHWSGAKKLIYDEDLRDYIQSLPTRRKIEVAS